MSEAETLELHKFVRVVLEHMIESNHNALALEDLFEAARSLGRAPATEREEICVQLLVVQARLARAAAKDAASQLLFLVLVALGAEQAEQMFAAHGVPEEQLAAIRSLNDAEQQKPGPSPERPSGKSGVGLRGDRTKKRRRV